MNKKLFVVLFLVATCALAITNNNQISSSQQKKLQEIVQDQKWASIIMNLAELHLMAKGPIENLVVAIQDVVADLEVKTENTHIEYQERSDLHQSESRRLNDLITNTIASIYSNQEHVDNILIPQKIQLQEELVNLNNRVEELTNLISTTEQGIVNRENEHNLRVSEYTNALEAISEAQSVLSQIEQGEYSFIQVSSAKQSIEKVKSQIKGKSVEIAFLEALLQTSTEQFANSQNLEKVFQLLAQIGESFENNLAQEQSDYTIAQENARKQIKEFQSDTIQTQNQIAERQTSLQYTEEQIAEKLELIELKKADQIGFETELQEENSSFERATESYNALVEQYASELNACNEALEIVQNLTLQDYISDRVNNESGVIDQSVGQRHGLNE